MKIDLNPLVKKLKINKIMSNMKNIKVGIILAAFIFGIVFIVNNHYIQKENMENRVQQSGFVSDKIKNKTKMGAFNEMCPNILIRKGNELHLMNTKKAKIPGVNPIKFDNLEEYAEFVEYQKKLNINCPVLYYQETYDTQNSKGMRLLDDPLDPNSGLSSNLEVPQVEPIQTVAPKTLLTDANVDNNSAYNQHQFSGFDEQDQYIGANTDLDTITGDESNGKSTNPMAKNWGGHEFTHNAIQEGKFEGRMRKEPNQFQANMDEY